ncbi:MAG TPA: hypothetical protein VFE32_20580 [Puia sp.]|jgi:hypothetical protein|nr:hypothetical protein [Puia sp.]
MKQKAKIASNAEEKSIIKNAIQSSENEQLDLYKAIFGGAGTDCNVAAPSNLRMRMTEEPAYDKHDTFLQAAL